MSGSRTFRPTTVSGGNNIFWQKRTGNNFTIELIPETGINSVFITKNLQVANEITVTSSEKEKGNIKDINNDVNDILKLNPKQYNYNNDSKLHFGLIAEDVEKVYPNLVSNTEVGKSLNYLEIVPLLIDKIKDLQNQIDELKRK
jgi:hypothetical protein|uniref:Peptidase S74 domain-containing protein n=1 Tax=viral metagenome TaxID=1070528 RepID=A0A6C0CXB6_9ZZZZ